MTMGRGGLFGYPKNDMYDAENIMFPASKRGLFGNPMAMAEQMAIPQRAPELAQQIPQEAAKPKFFGDGGTGRAIAGSIGDALLQMNGMQPIYAQSVDAKRQQQMQQAKRQQEWDDWVAQQKYKRENPERVNNDTVNDYQFISQTMGEEAGKQYLQNKVNPPQYRQGPDGRFYRIDTAEGAMPTAPVGRLTPIPDAGGPTPPASGGFLR